MNFIFKLYQILFITGNGKWSLFSSHFPKAKFGNPRIAITQDFSEYIKYI